MDTGRLRPLGWAEMRAGERRAERRVKRRRRLAVLGLLLVALYVGYHVALYRANVKAWNGGQASGTENLCAS